MRPIVTESTNAVLLPAPGTEDTVFKLPVTLTDYNVASCWQMTWRERLRTLRTGLVWFHCKGNTHPPIRLSVEFISDGRAK